MAVSIGELRHWPDRAIYERDMMKQTQEAFEHVLLSHTEMCYSVALAMTRDPVRAQNLTRNVLTWAWHLRASADREKHIKIKLLIALRKRFLKDYPQPCGRGNHAVHEKNTMSFAQDA